MHPSLLSSVFLLGICHSSPLDNLTVNNNTIAVSGFSSGGCFATQFHTAFSKAVSSSKPSSSSSSASRSLAWEASLAVPISQLMSTMTRTFLLRLLILQRMELLILLRIFQETKYLFTKDWLTQ